MTLNAFVALWKESHVEKKLAPKTVHRYKEMLNSRILPAMGHLKIDKITPAKLREFYSNLKEDGIRADGKSGGLSDRTLLHHHRLISSILGKAVEWEIISTNSASKVKLEVKKTRVQCYNDDEIGAMLDALESEPVQHKVIVYLAVGGGFRRGEIMGLEWCDINFEDESVQVRQASQYVPGKGTFTKDPKNEMSRRAIALPSYVMELLKELKSHQEKMKENAGDKWHDSDRLFTKWDGQPMHPDTISNWFPKFLARHGLRHMNFHGMRHSSATSLVGQGVHQGTISSRLGHSSISTTMDIYVSPISRADKEAANKLDALLRRKRDKE
jgi:integrase